MPALQINRNNDGAHRFDWMLESASFGADIECDRHLLGNNHFAVTPTLGSIVPNWVLIVPKIRVLSFAGLGTDWRSNLDPILDQVKNRLHTEGRELVCFEHGPASHGGSTGCGVDQAHLHVLALNSGFLEFIIQTNLALEWKSIHHVDPWSRINRGQDYYLMQSRDTCFVSYPEQSVSQFFRKAVARFVGQRDDWDYNLVPHYDNARRTIRRFAVS